MIKELLDKNKDLMRMNVSIYENLFLKYVRKFYTDDSSVQRNIILKEKHSLHVRDNIIEISKGLNLSSEDIKLATIIALFHDIGRFKQFSTYKTFDDSKSVNHAKYGIQVLEEEAFLENLEESDKSIVYTAIRNHNAIVLPEIEDKKTQLFCKLIRDADKLDVWNIILTENEKDENSDISLGFSNNTDLNPEIVKDIKKKQIIDYKLITSALDYKIILLSWVYNINFDYTFNLIKKREVVKKIIETLPEIKEIQSMKEEILNFIDSRVIS